MHKKGAIELSMNMLVVIIISLIVLAGGITFLYKLLAGAGDIQKDLDSRTNAELERLLVEQGKQVVLPFRQATLERGEQSVFGLGILNIGAEQGFQIQLSLQSAVNTQQEELGPATADVQDWLLYNTEPFTLAENEHRSEGILVQVPPTALPGQYIFSVRVLTAEGNQYGNVQMIIVEVR